MTKREEKIAKYVAMLNDLKKKCVAGEIIPTREFCALHQVGHMSVKAAIHFGYAKKLSHQRFKWIVTGDVTPIMAKCIIDWNTAYTISSKHKKKDASTNIIISDVHIAKDDCEITKLKYQAMLDHQKIVDLETETRALHSVADTHLHAYRRSMNNCRAIENQLSECRKSNKLKSDHIQTMSNHIEDLILVIKQVPTVTYYLFGIPVWKRKEKVSR